MKIQDEKVRDVLRRIEVEDEQERVWIVGPEVGELLYDLILELVRADEGHEGVSRKLTCLEIGTSVGYSAIWMGSAMRGGKLWTVESHAERFERARANVVEAGLEDLIVQVKGHAPEVFEDASFGIPDELDFVFFDATKYEHASYFDVVFPRMRAGSMLVVDNVISHGEEMADFVNMLKKHPQLECELHEIGAGVLVCKVSSLSRPARQGHSA